MNISVKKFSKKSLSLLIALIMVFSALPLTPPISADAATVSKSVKVANYGVLSSGGRIDSNVFEIVNDGRNGNFSIGCVRFNISNLEAYKHEVTSAMYNISHYANSSRTNNMYIGFYYPTKNLDTYSLTNGSATNSGTFYSNIFNNTNDSNHTHISAAKSYFGLQEITTVLSRADNSTNSVSIDIAPLINYALKNNTTATLMIMLTAYDQTDNSAPWSDRKVTVSTSDFNVTANEKTFSTEVTSSNNANSTTNRVKIGDAIYTYESSSAYYNYGKTISTESDWNTPISTTNTISKVECLDDGSLLSVSNNKLSGTFNDNKFKVSENTSVNATLKFTFSDGKIEYHRVAVKSYPVENHVCVFAERSGESEAGYTMFLRGSTGSGGSGVWNYNKSYYTSGNTAHGSPDRNCVVGDKKAYVYGYSYSNWNNNNDAVPSVSLATYYIDKSCSGTSWSSLGNSELWNSSTNNYSISIDLVRTKFQYPLGDGWTLDLNNSPVQGKLTIPQNPQKSDVNGTTYTSTFTHNSSVSTSNRYSSCKDTTCNVRLAVHAHDKGWALMKTNMVVNLFDKSAARNLYINYLNENKVSDSYTADSFAAYQNALLDMEAYLSNYEDTTNATENQKVYTNLVNAHNNLKARRYTVTFYNYDDYVFMLTPTTTIEVQPGTTISQLPNNTATKSIGNNQHEEYVWINHSDRTNFTSSTVINSDMIVGEIKKTVNCTYDENDATCMSKALCSVCKAPVGNLKEHSYTKETFVDAVGNNNSYTKYTCTMCGQEDETVKAREYTDQSSYWETYRALRAQAKDKIAENAATNGAKYTSASINALENAIARVREEEVCDKTKSQSYIENENTILRVATNELKLNQYSITVKYVDELGNDLKVGEEGATSKTYDAVDYGTVQNIVAPTSYNGNNYAVYKWTRKGTNGDIISGLNSSSLDVVVKGASTYYVFLKNTSVDDTKVGKNAVITLNNKSGNIVDIGYVPMNQNGTETKKTVTVDTDAGTIKIGDTTLTAPKYSFYNLIGFEIGGIRVASGQTITLNSKMVIRPVYKAKQTVRITRASADILINGKNVESVDVEWNKKIVMTYDGEVPDGQVVIWKDGNGNVLAQGITYTFYSNSNVTISASVEAYAPKDPTASIGYFDYDSTLNKVTVVNNFYVPDGMKATKAGVILSTKSTLATMNNEERVNFLKAQTNGKFEGDESQFTTDKNQIRISVSRTANTSFTMYALAYVVVGDTTYYAPTVQSITYTVTNS